MFRISMSKKFQIPILMKFPSSHRRFKHSMQVFPWEQQCNEHTESAFCAPFRPPSLITRPSTPPPQHAENMDTSSPFPNNLSFQNLDMPPRYSFASPTDPFHDSSQVVSPLTSPTVSVASYDGGRLHDTNLDWINFDNLDEPDIQDNKRQRLDSNDFFNFNFEARLAFGGLTAPDVMSSQIEVDRMLADILDGRDNSEATSSQEEEGIDMDGGLKDGVDLDFQHFAMREEGNFYYDESEGGGLLKFERTPGEQINGHSGAVEFRRGGAGGYLMGFESGQQRLGPPAG